jgi:phosphoserine aminotransferase
MARVTNFNAGPAGLPLPALERAREELVDYAGTGMSIMEHSHRGKTYEGVHKEAMSLIRELLGLPDDFEVIFVQGGATTQFAVLPMNFLGKDRSVDYVVTGHWSERAVEEARTVAGLVGGTVHIAGDVKDAGKFNRIPAQDELQVNPGSAYLHITSNNTIFGTQWFHEPATEGVPLVADMSSDFMWRKHDMARYALVYAGAQKNLGPSGVTVVLARKSFLAGGRKDIPSIFRYASVAAAESMLNTPPTFAVYLMRNVLLWIKSLGGLAALEARNRRKAELLYGAIEEEFDYYRCPVAKADRSVMNVVFRLPNDALESRFVSEAEKAGMVGLKGYRTVGGVRVSMYNAVSPEDVEKLVGFMKEFAGKNRP